MAEELEQCVDIFLKDFDKDGGADLVAFTEARTGDDVGFPESFKIFKKDLIAKLKMDATIDTAADAKATAWALFKKKKSNLKKRSLKKKKKATTVTPPPSSPTVPQPHPETRKPLLRRLHAMTRQSPRTPEELREMNYKRAFDAVNRQLRNTGL